MTLKMEQCDEVFARAWVKALGAAKAVSDAIESQTGATPAQDAQSDERKQAISEMAWLTLISDCLYTTNVAIFLASKHGIIPFDFLQGMEQQFMAFTVSALGGMRAVCRAPGCDWRGEIQECGPSGFCPKCKQRSAEPFVLDKALNAPNGLVSEGGIILTGGNIDTRTRHDKH